MYRPPLELLVLAALCVACVGAVTAVGAETGGAATQAGTIVVAENVTVDLRPAATPNGNRYAALDGNDELRVDFEDLNRGSRTTADRVFTIDVDAAADQYVEATVTSDSEDVSFYWGASPSKPAADGVVLAADEQVAVGVAVDAGATVDGGTFTVTITEADEPEDDPDDRNDSDEESEEESDSDETTDSDEHGASSIEPAVTDVQFPAVNATDAAVLDVSIRNTAAQTVTETVGLDVDGQRVAAQTVTVPGGATRSVAFEYRFPEPGTYEIGLGGQVVGSITVDPPRLRVSNAALSRDVVERGESVTVVADVENYGQYGDRFVAELTIGGAVVDRDAVYVEPGATERVSFEWSFDQRGGYDVAVSGEPAGTVQVESPFGASIRRHGSRHGPLLGVLSIPALAGAAAFARSNLALFAG